MVSTDVRFTPFAGMGVTAAAAMRPAVGVVPGAVGAPTIDRLAWIGDPRHEPAPPPDAVPGARYIDVANAGHMVAGDQNDHVTTAILDFLDERQPHPT